MKTIKLLKLALENFKGIKHLEINAGGENLSVYGNNGTGKTTIADAFSWLLFGKDSEGRSDFEIKTLDKDGKPINFIDHSVTATLLVSGCECGREITLEKIYREKWVRQRGSVDREFQGHETEYIIDGIPKSKSEYTAYIEEIADENVFRLLTNPMYFNNSIDKKKRREMLFDIFGDISDNEVIAKNYALLGDLTDLIGTHTLDEIKTAITAKKRRISADLQAIPDRIDEANRFISNKVKESPEALEAELEKYQKRMLQKTDALRDLKTDTVADEYRRKAREEIRELEMAAREEIDEAKKNSVACDEAVKNVSYELNNVEREIADKTRVIDLNQSRIHSGNKMLEQFRQEWQTVFDSKYESDNKCPTCGQHLPTEQIEAAIAKFNANKAKNLDRINGEAESIKKHITEFETDIEFIKSEIKTLEARREHLKNKKIELQKDADDAEKTIYDVKVKHSDKITEKKNALAEWENSRTVGDTVAEVRESLEGDITVIWAKICAIQGDITTLNNNKRFEVRIAELASEAKTLAGEYEKLERTEYLIGEFTKIKASMLEAKINSKFKYARFKLFETQINGGIVETCEVTYNGVPYSVLNSAMKLNIGIDIINVFSEHYGLTGVIFLDNAESVTEIYATPCQLVKLYVSAEDDMLRVEKDF